MSNLGGVTSERAQAYGRVVATIDQIGATKLSEDEQSTIRDAADALLFSDEVGPQTPELMSARELLDRLVESERWLEETAERLLADLESCGPLALSR